MLIEPPEQGDPGLSRSVVKADLIALAAVAAALGLGLIWFLNS